MWKRHHVQSRDLQRKLRLKWAAINVLPTAELRREALVVDPFAPLWTRVPTLSPPLKGFHTEQRAVGGEDDDDMVDATAAKAAMDTRARDAGLKSAAAFGTLGSAARSRSGRSDGGMSLLRGIAAVSKTASSQISTPAKVLASDTKNKGKKK